MHHSLFVSSVGEVGNGIQYFISFIGKEGLSLFGSDINQFPSKNSPANTFSLSVNKTMQYFSGSLSLTLIQHLFNNSDKPLLVRCNVSLTSIRFLFINKLPISPIW